MLLRPGCCHVRQGTPLMRGQLSQLISRPPLRRNWLLHAIPTHSEPSDSPFNTSDADLIYSVNVVNFQWTVFISDFMHMRDKTVELYVDFEPKVYPC